MTDPSPITITVHRTCCWPCMTGACPRGPHRVDDMPDVECGCGCAEAVTDVGAA